MVMQWGNLMSAIYTVHPLIFIIVIIALALLWVVLHDLFKGYSVSITGEKNCDLRYTESWKGSLILYNDACMDADGKYYNLVQVPTNVKWKEEMPEWAKERRFEIMERIIKELGTDHCRFLGYIDV